VAAEHREQGMNDISIITFLAFLPNPILIVVLYRAAMPMDNINGHLRQI
jgi:hypothetical protein